MRTRGSLTATAAAVGLLAALGFAVREGRAQSAAPGAAPSASRHLTLTSPDFANGGTLHRSQVNARCGGRDISPALEWRDPPLGTESYVVLMHDPDAPKAGGFWHWVVYDIPVSVTSLPAGAGDAARKLMPSGAIQARSDFGTLGYGGPCPPPGPPHRYFIRIYAMPVPKLNVPKGATASIVAAYADATALGRAQLMGRYGR